MQKRSAMISAAVELVEHGVSLFGRPLPCEGRGPAKALRSHRLPAGWIPQERAKGVGEGVDVVRRGGPRGGAEHGDPRAPPPPPSAPPATKPVKHTEPSRPWRATRARRSS